MLTQDELIALGLNPEFSEVEIEAVFLHTKHSVFHEIEFSKFTNLKVVVDGRNFFEPDTFGPNVVVFK